MQSSLRDAANTPGSTESHALPDKQRKRASRPKVRTGCLTCKKRHVKCDERRPRCLRCEQGQYSCDGYMSKTAPASPVRSDTVGLERNALCETSRKRFASLYPKPQWGQDLQAPRKGALCAPRHLVVTYMDDRNAVYFDLFRLHVVPDLSGYAYSQFWSSTVLREAMNDDCIRHCVLGIGALAHTLNSFTPDVRSLMGFAGHDRVVNEHHEAAIRHYTEALATFRRRTTDWSDASTRLLLPATILFLTFEFLQGHIAAVDNLITTALGLLKSKRQASANSSKALDPETEEVESLLPRMAVLSGLSAFCPKQQRNQWVISLPPAKEVPDCSAPVQQIVSAWKSTFTRASAFASWGQHSAIIHGNELIDVGAVLQEQAELLRHLEEWRALLEARIPQEQDPVNRRRLRVIQIQHGVSKVFVAGSLDGTNVAYDQFEESFRVILAQIRSYLLDPGPESKTSFTFEIGIIPMICFVIHNCRRHEVRMQAADVLASLASKGRLYREGPWDARVLAKGFREVALLEKSGADKATGLVPAHARYKWTGVEVDEGTGRMMALFTRLVPDKSGSHVVVRSPLAL